MKTISDETYQLIVTALAQCDYGIFHGDWDCMEAGFENAKKALIALGQKTAEQESEEEEE